MELITKYFPGISARQKEQFKALFSIYEEWNQQINVISRKDMENFYERHVLHSLGLAKVLSFKAKTRILDAGTGGGFPGIPLAILFPECHFHLVDSIGKKIRVVQNVIQQLELSNVTAEQQRVEKLSHEYDFVISRAVTEMGKFHQWVNPKIRPKGFNSLPNGILYLKGGDLSRELGELKRPYTLYPLIKHFEESFFETKSVVYIKK